MKILFVTQGDIQTASSKYRAFRVSEFLNGQIPIEIFVPSCLEFNKLPLKAKAVSLLRLLAKTWSMKREDILYAQRAIYSTYMLAVFAIAKYLFRRKMVFDMEDAIFLSYPGRTKLMIKMADVVLAGSHYVADFAAKHNPSTHLIPFSLPFAIYEKYQKNEPSHGNKKIVGWVGDGPAHYKNLTILEEALRHLAKRRTDFKFVLIGAKNYQPIYRLFDSLPEIETQIIDWIHGSDEEGVANAIRQFDIGLMPLQDTEWSRGKCALKALQYMACGLATIVSPIGENLHVVQEEVNGLFAKEPLDWAKQIERLLKDDDLRSYLGRNARERIRAEYSFATNVPKMMEVLRKI